MVFARGLTMPSLKTFRTITVSWCYKSGRAPGLGKSISRFWSWWASLGLPPYRQVARVVKGEELAASGLLFGLGLTVSQMINPAKVIGFLDIFGDWDPSLGFVMATAIPLTAAGYAVARRCR